MKRLVVLAVPALLAGCSATAKQSAVKVVLKCDGEATSEAGKRPDSITYRINSQARTFETWDGEQFHAWGEASDLEVGADMIFFSNGKPEENGSSKSVNINRVTGQVSETTKFEVNGEQLSPIVFEGVCKPVDEPEKVRVKF